ncbi:hypothetical protein C1646_766277 [Rhizophagus diaphanus]|nr:hypothetical protein C1646_766277 [Rhizophagus diaphanus] [Rhizophagus sp. MUCL 43196]
MSTSGDPRSCISSVKMIRYFGENCLTGIPTRDKLVAENDLNGKGLTSILKDAISSRREISFMPVNIEETKEYINQIPQYVLRLYGPLVNSQKVVVTLTGIKFYFRVSTPNKKQRFTALKIIREYNSQVDVSHPEFRLETSTDNKEDAECLESLYKIYPSSLIFRDRTLVLTWDIETYGFSGKFPKAERDTDHIFMIYYDWPFIVKKATKFKVLKWMVQRMSANLRKKANTHSILTWNYYGGEGEPFNNNFFRNSRKWKGRAKLQSDSSRKNNCSKDVCASFRQIYPNSEKYSLRYFLEKCDLDGKADMPFDKMWKICSEARKQPSEITKQESRQFSGTYIFPPEKGLKMKQPVMGLDFAFLYSSIIITYNLLPEKMILSPEKAAALMRDRKDLYNIKFSFSGWAIRS